MKMLLQENVEKLAPKNNDPSTAMFNKEGKLLRLDKEIIKEAKAHYTEIPRRQGRALQVKASKMQPEQNRRMDYFRCDKCASTSKVRQI